MSSTGYVAWQVTAGEQPTTAYWNILGTNDASFNNGAGFNDGILIKRHFGAGEVGKAVNNYQFMMTQAGAATTGTGGFFLVPLDTATIDPNSNCNTTTHGYTVPVTGYWNIAGSVGYAGSGAGQHHIVTIFRNANEWIRFFEGTGDTSNNVFSGSMPVAFCTAGDVLTLEGYSSTNYNLMVNGANPSYYTYMAGRLMST